MRSFLPNVCAHITISAAILVCPFQLVVTHCLAQSSSWQIGTSSGDWFDATHWNNGVPNGPGAIAILPGSSSFHVQANQPFTLGELDFTGPLQTNVFGTGQLVFDQPGAGSALIRADSGASGAAINATISIPLSIAAGETLAIDLAAPTTLSLGSIVAGSGNVIKTGLGTLMLAGSSPMWDGTFSITSGRAVLSGASALGSTVGNTTVSGGAILTLQSSTAEPIELNSGTMQVNTTAAITLSNPIQLTGNGTISNASTTVATTFNNVVSGTGDATFQNSASAAMIIGGNSTYTAHTYVSGTSFRATSSSAFGDSSNGTTLQSGTLSVEALTDELFTVAGGTLTFTSALASYNHAVTVDGGTLSLPGVATALNVPVIAGPNGGRVQFVGTGNWTGGSSGTGNLQLVGSVNVNGSLSHSGSLTIDRAKLNTANSYQGDTIVTGASELDNAGGFGSSPAVHIRNNGALTLNVQPNVSPQYFVEQGTLTFANPTQPVTAPITLGGSTANNGGAAALVGPGVFNGPIHLDPAGVNNQRITNATLNGQINGDGALKLSGTVNVNAANDFRGWTEVTDGTVTINNPAALNLGATSVSGGHLVLNVPANGNVITNQSFSTTGTVTFNAPQNYNGAWVVNAGAIEAAAQVGMPNLIGLGGTIRGIGSGTFRLDGDMTALRSTAIEGGISGSGNIDFSGAELRVAQNLSNFTGAFNIHTGLLSIGYLSSGFTAPTTLNSASDINIYDEATLNLPNATSSTGNVIPNNIFLHNAHGYFGYAAALMGNPGNGSQTLSGHVDVGDQGSTIVGNFLITGRLTGSNPNFAYGGIELANTQDQLRGVVRLTQQAALHFDDQGKLFGASEIRIESGSTLSFGGSSSNDRLDDATGVDSLGGFIQLYSNTTSQTRETLGTLKLLAGSTQLFISSDHDGTQAAALTINNLQRLPGATLHFAQAGFQNTVKVNNGIDLKYGMIGPWATTSDGFATVGANGVITTQSTTMFADINSATAQDHVRVTGNQSLTSDKSIASLQYDPNGSPASMNLNGHEFTILSGGVFRSDEITNGRITAGESGNAELDFHSSSKISADIVDNVGGGSVGVVIDSTSMQLTGNNTYTGGTWIVGSVYYGSPDAAATILSPSAIPAHDRVYVDKALYAVQIPSATTISIDELHVRNGGMVTTGLATLNVQQMFLEQGSVNGTITGSGTITKVTDGGFDLTTVQGPNFTGSVDVQDGVLTIAYNALPKAEFDLEGGRLDVSGSSNFTNKIVLKGGAIGLGQYTGAVDVQSNSEIVHSNTSTLLSGKLTGFGDLTIHGSQLNPYTSYVGLFGDMSQYSGNIEIASGALRLGTPGNAGSGVITVDQAGRLILGSNSYSDPTETLNNEIQVNGGTVYSTPPTSSSTGTANPSVLTGNVFVHQEAFIGALSTGFKNNVRLPGLTFGGSLTLTDGANVFGLSDGRSSIATGSTALVDISGEMRVGSDTVWHLLSSSLSISGIIRPNGPSGSIDFEGIPSLLQMNGAGIQVDAGQSLSIKLNGQAAEVLLSGGGNSIQGSGILAGDYTVVNGAAVAPGNSPGLLTINGDMTFGSAGLLSTQLAGLSRGSQYDALDVSGDVVISGAILDVSFLNGFTPTSNDAFIIMRAHHVTGRFANATNSILVNGQSLPITYFDQMVVLGNAAAVPEPSSVALLCFLIGVVGWRPLRFSSK